MWGRIGKCNFIRTLKLYHLWPGCQIAREPGSGDCNAVAGPGVTPPWSRARTRCVTAAWHSWQYPGGPRFSWCPELRSDRCNGHVWHRWCTLHRTVQSDTRVTRANLARTNGSNNNKSQQFVLQSYNSIKSLILDTSDSQPQSPTS